MTTPQRRAVRSEPVTVCDRHFGSAQGEQTAAHGFRMIGAELSHVDFGSPTAELTSIGHLSEARQSQAQKVAGLGALETEVADAARTPATLGLARRFQRKLALF